MHELGPPLAGCMRMKTISTVRLARTLALLLPLGLLACTTDPGDDPLAQVTQELAGDLDPGYGTGGFVLTDGNISPSVDAGVVRVQADGKIVLVGSAHNGLRWVGVIMRLDADGARDTSFGGGRGWVMLDAGLSTFLRDLQIAPDGKLVAAGQLTDGAGLGQVIVARFNGDGTPDTSFSGDGHAELAVSPLSLAGRALRLQSDGKIVVAGRLSTSSDTDLLIVRFTAGGALDTSFAGLGWTSVSAGGSEEGFGVALQGDGKIVVAGSTNTSGTVQFLAVRLLSGGGLDTSFSGDGIAPILLSGHDVASSVLVQSDGKIVLAGNMYGGDGSNYDVALVRLSTTGALDPSFSGDGKLSFAAGAFYEDAATIVQRSDGRLLVGGSVAVAGGGGNMLFAQVTAAGALDPSFDGDGLRQVSFSGASAAARSLALEPDGHAMALGVRIVGSLDSRLAVVRLNPGGALDGNFNGTGKVTPGLQSGEDRAFAAVVQPDGKLVAVGRSHNGFYEQCLVVRYTTSGALDPAFSGDGKLIFSMPVEADCSLAAVALQPDGKIVVGSNNTNLRGWAFARITAAGALDPSFSGDGKVIHIAGSAFGGVPDLLVQPDGKILAAVRIWQNGEDFAIARLNADGTLDASFSGDGWTSTGFGPNNDMIARIALLPDGRILAAGRSVDLSSALLTRFLPTGSVDGNFGVGGRALFHTGLAHDTFATLAVQADGKIVASGTAQDGFISSDMVLWRFTAGGALDSSFGTGGAARLHPTPLSGTAATVRLADGRAVLVGRGADPSTGANGCLLVRATAAGALDTSFGGGDGWSMQSIGTTCTLAAVALEPATNNILAAGFTTFEPPPSGGLSTDHRTAWDVLALRVQP